MEESFNVRESTLCDKCSILRIEDKEMGGYIAQNDAGKTISDISGPDLYFWDMRLDHTHHDVFPDLPCLRASAEAGCAFCALLRSTALELNLVNPGQVTFELHYSWGQDNPKRHLGLRILVVNIHHHEYGHKSYKKMTFQVDCEEGRCQRWLNTALTPRAQTLCKENVAWMRQALDECNAECGSPSTSNFFPTRLIDLGDVNHGRSIRLIESSSAQSQPPIRYAALSYCWGTKEQATQQLTTTSKTLAQHIGNISFGEMTPVMQDMVKTARALSIGYIWIDALCIIQDDHEDWTREAERMGSIYANSFVTICAISTTSCMDSFLDRSAPPVRVAFQSSLQPDIYGHLNLRHVRYHPERNVDEYKERRQRDVDLDVGAWSLRAWTLQEGELPHRLLCFGAARVHFSCPKQTITEMEHGSSDPASLFSHKLQRCKQGEPEEYIRREWHKLVSSYVWRRSTKPKDRFPAIAGMAKLMAEATGWTYVAGLWKNSLPGELLWHTCSFDSNTMEELVQRFSVQSPHTYIGPSWSWTHCRQISFPDFNSTRSIDPRDTQVDFRSECRYLEATCTPDSSDSSAYGRLKDSKLRIGGKVIKLDLGWEFGRSRLPQVKYGSCITLCYPDSIVNEANEEGKSSDLSFLLLASNYGPEIFGGGKPWRTSDESPRILQYDENGNMTQESVQACEIPSNRNAHGLLIHAIDNGARYVRVGWFRAGTEGALLPFADRPFEDVELV